MDLLGSGSGSTLVMGLVLGIIGMAYFSYGKKMQRGLPLACGLGLMVVPYFVSNMPVLLAIGAILGVAPWVAR